MSRAERILFYGLAAISAGLRAVAFFRYRFDSDEQQHLHVAWGWTAGLVQYRDFFDNHAPLFHILTAPILAMVGERRDVLLWMRLPMLALFAATLYGTYLIGRELYDHRVGLWAALLLSLFPPFFLKSLEYRADTLWTMLWIAALVLLVQQRRMFVAGLLLGAAFATSVKTALLIVPLAAAMLIAKWWRTGNPACPSWFARADGKGQAGVPVLHLLSGMAIVPLALIVYFAAAGAWDELVYCTITFNGNVYATKKHVWVGRAIFPFALAGVLYAAWRWRASSWRYVLALMMGLFTVTLAGFWILISPREFLPIMPLAAIFAAAMIHRARVYAIVAALCIASLWYYADRFENRTDWHKTMLDQALRLTRPGEPLLDVKGETIYRPRPTYFIFENITRAQIARGMIKDTVAEDVIRTRTHVAQADGPMWPPRARAFLSENFLNMGRLRASGQWLKEDGSFTIAVPGEYVIVSERGAVGPAHEYATGAYRIRNKPDEPLAVMWAPAFRRGHSPFHLRDLRF